MQQTEGDWDTWFLYLLFAYRDVQQASKGFSLFELLHGRQGTMYKGCLTLSKKHEMEYSRGTIERPILCQDGPAEKQIPV